MSGRQCRCLITSTGRPAFIANIRVNVPRCAAYPAKPPTASGLNDHQLMHAWQWLQSPCAVGTGRLRTAACLACLLNNGRVYSQRAITDATVHRRTTTCAVAFPAALAPKHSQALSKSYNTYRRASAWASRSMCCGMPHRAGAQHLSAYQPTVGPAPARTRPRLRPGRAPSCPGQWRSPSTAASCPCAAPCTGR